MSDAEAELSRACHAADRLFEALDALEGLGGLGRALAG